MKKSVLILAACTFIISSILISCNSSSNKLDKAKKNVIEANKDLDNATQDYLDDIENFRIKTANRIAANDQTISELKTKMEHNKKVAKADYKKNIAILEQKNRDMKKKMDDYKDDGKENWAKFKAEFSHDMDELGKAFTDLTVKNVK